MNCILLALRKLKYRFLPAFIGREVSVPSIDQVEESVLVFVSTLISARFKLKTSEESLSGVMRKHGFLDLTLVSADQVLGRADRISRAVIRELGYSPRPKDRLQTCRGR